jgi:TRAP-type C4-dicarboxylate transport system substrate-binding protein
MAPPEKAMRPMLVTALAVVTAACGGSGADKAGGKAPGKAVLLTLAAHDDLYAHGSFAAAVERLSGGSIRVEFRGNWRDGEADYERGLIGDVREGKADLGIVGVRVWDTLGVTSFRALLAPFLVDSLGLERRALEGPRAARALDAVAEAGVVGIAVLPGTLRRPLGLARALVGPSDYRGATFGIRLGGVADATVRALGATADGYVPGSVSDLDGAELDLTTIADNGYDRLARALTANVVLWPRAQTVDMHRSAFRALTRGQQAILRAAGREAVGPELLRVERDEARALVELCRTGSLSLARASAADVAALRAAVRPVYEELERDPQTKAWLAEIAELRGRGLATRRDAIRCPGAPTPRETDASRVEGRWKMTKATLQELLDAGVARKQAVALAALPGTPALVLETGRHTGIDLETGAVLSSGTYDVDGDIISLVFETGVAVELGTAYRLRWSAYRDSLTFSAVAGREPLQALILGPWTRVP